MNILREFFIDLGIWTFAVFVIGCGIFLIIGIRRLALFIIRHGAGPRNRWAKEATDHDMIQAQAIHINTLKRKVDLLEHRNYVLRGFVEKIEKGAAVLDYYVQNGATQNFFINTNGRMYTIIFTAFNQEHVERYDLKSIVDVLIKAADAKKNGG